MLLKVMKLGVRGRQNNRNKGNNANDAWNCRCYNVAHLTATCTKKTTKILNFHGHILG